MSILALDIGRKRVWIAIENQGIAFPLKIVVRANLVKEIKKLLNEREVKVIVVGMPYGEYDGWNDAIDMVKKTIDMLKNTFPDIRFQTEDERFTTSIAQGFLDEMWKSEEKKDDIAAALILESYLSKN